MSAQTTGSGSNSQSIGGSGSQTTGSGAQSTGEFWADIVSEYETWS